MAQSWFLLSPLFIVLFLCSVKSECESGIEVYSGETYTETLQEAQATFSSLAAPKFKGSFIANATDSHTFWLTCVRGGGLLPVSKSSTFVLDEVERGRGNGA
jgi:hypothetical protein